MEIRVFVVVLINSTIKINPKFFHPSLCSSAAFVHITSFIHWQLF